MQNVIYWYIRIYTTVHKWVYSYHNMQQSCHHYVPQKNVSSSKHFLTYSAYCILTNTYEPYILQNKLIPTKQTRGCGGWAEL